MVCLLHDWRLLERLGWRSLFLSWRFLRLLRALVGITPRPNGFSMAF